MNSKNNHVFHSINTSKLGLNYKHSFDNSKSLGRKLRKAFLSKNSMQFIQPKILETSFIIINLMEYFYRQAMSKVIYPLEVILIKEVLIFQEKIFLILIIIIIQ